MKIKIPTKTEYRLRTIEERLDTHGHQIECLRDRTTNWSYIRRNVARLFFKALVLCAATALGAFVFFTVGKMVLL